MPKRKSNTAMVYVGTYTTGDSEGIYIFRLDRDTGVLQPHGVEAAIQPSFLALHPRGGSLYAVNETREYEGRPGGAVGAYAIEPGSGHLQALNQRPSLGPAPCHLSVDATGRYVLVANYGGGSVTVLPVAQDGRLDESSDFIQHHGSSVDPRRQTAPHAHGVLPDPTNTFVFVTDLGLDQIVAYRLESAQGKLHPVSGGPTKVRPGAGPRHLAWHPRGQIAYVVNELDSTVDVYGYHADRGMLEHRQTVSTLPEGTAAANHAADIHVHPSGRIVYVSNRGHDSIAVYGIEDSTGKLTCGRHQLTQGKTPRNFVVDPTGTWLLAANQNSHTIVTFRIDQQTGGLEPTCAVADVPDPTCIKILMQDGA